MGIIAVSGPVSTRDAALIKSVVAGVVPEMRAYFDDLHAPLKAENESLKERIVALEAVPVPERGEQGERGADGVSPELEAVAVAFQPVAEQMIAEAIAKAVADLPPPERGEKGEPGGDADLVAINQMVVAEVEKVVGALPPPKDGENGKDAAGIVEALKDNGELVLTLEDGRLIRTGVRDGEKGQDGRDGFGFDDMDVAVLDDDRTIELSFRRGEDEKAFTLKWPTTLDRGVYKLDQEYEAGDGVTWGGQFYFASEATKGVKPDQAKDGKPWRLAIRKGRDGKDAKGG